MKTYLVGGAVRDKLLGIPLSDCDWVVIGSTPEEMLALGFKSVGADFPVFLHPETQQEYALARTERKNGRGYGGFAVDFHPGVMLQEDLRRRDLTINAMAMDVDGNLLDPWGGKMDLDNRILRHVSEAFRDDPLRVLRVARFAAKYKSLGFTVAPETMELLRVMVKDGELVDLTAERVWAEFYKALKGPNVRVFFETLHEVGALAILLPEVDRLWGVPQRADYHPEVDTGIHVMMVMEQAEKLSESALVRFAALVHDLGKGLTPADILPKHYGHEETSARLVDGVCDRLRIPTAFRELAVHVARYHGHVHRVDEMKSSTVLKMLTAVDAYRRPERFADFLLACEADARGRLGLEDREYPQRQWLLDVLEATKKVDVFPLMDRGLKGDKIAEGVRRIRIARINSMRTKEVPTP